MVSRAQVNLVHEIDTFLPSRKWLDGSAPEWFSSTRDYEVTANWNIIEEGGISRAKLVFRLSRAATDEPSVSVVYRSHMCFRVDVKPDDICEQNPLWAKTYGLPAEVCGTHKHPWTINRLHCLNSPIWELPVRANVSQSTRRIHQILALLSDEIGLELTSEQRQFDGPPKRDLFGV